MNEEKVNEHSLYFNTTTLSDFVYRAMAMTTVTSPISIVI